MKISVASGRLILVPCSLPSFEFQIDPYVGCAHLCHYCYVLDQAETDWAEEVLVHADLAERLGAALEGLPPQTIYMGYHSDAYQPCEAEHRQTRTVLEILLERGFSASILTKSDLVRRDLDILAKMPDARVSFSVAFSDDAVRRRFEGGTIETERRIDALREVKEAGVASSVLICPVIPHITDVGALLDAVAPHADAIWVYRLSVQDESSVGWRNVRDLLATDFADRRDEIEAAVLDGEHPYWRGLRRELEIAERERGLDLRVHV